MAPVPWADYSPWDYINVLKKGVSTKGEKDLVELPGCAKSFVNFEQYLLDSNFLKPVSQNELSSYLIDMKFLYEIGIKYFRNNYDKLLCPKGTCRPCDARRSQFLE
jgi:hypothetical protein